jgi:anti-sigma28 factor (negative regulator of flagellin synthesis)
MSESSVDEARVARIAARIQSGQYQIDDRRVATRMIELDKSIQQTMNHDG